MVVFKENFYYALTCSEAYKFIEVKSTNQEVDQLKTIQLEWQAFQSANGCKSW